MTSQGIVRNVSLALLLLLSMAAAGVDSKPAELTHSWRPAEAEDADFLNSYLLAYGVAATSPVVQVIRLPSEYIVRIQRNDLCYNELCTTLVVSRCNATACPATSVFAERRVIYDSLIANQFAGAMFIHFPLRHRQQITVMVHARLVSVWRGFGEENQ